MKLYAKQRAKQVHDFILSGSALLLTLHLPAQAAADSNSWTLEVEDNGVTVWTRPHSDSRYKEARGEITIKADAEKIFSVIVSAETCVHWVYGCVESYVIRRPIPKDGIVYMRTNSLWPISDRDAVFLATTHVDPVSGIYRSELRSLANEINPKDGVVRITAMTGEWVVQQKEKGDSLVTFFSHVEPGGYLPVALVNFALARLHSNSLLKLRAYLNKN